MSGDVPFHPLEKQRKSEGTGEETDLRGDVKEACNSGYLQKYNRHFPM